MKVTDQIKLLVEAKAFRIGSSLIDGIQKKLEKESPSKNGEATGWARSIGASLKADSVDFTVEFNQHVVSEDVKQERSEIVKKVIDELSTDAGIKNVIET
jgi:hypothetical protein